MLFRASHGIHYFISISQHRGRPLSTLVQQVPFSTVQQPASAQAPLAPSPLTAQMEAIPLPRKALGLISAQGNGSALNELFLPFNMSLSCLLLYHHSLPPTPPLNTWPRALAWIYNQNACGLSVGYRHALYGLLCLTVSS